MVLCHLGFPTEFDNSNANIEIVRLLGHFMSDRGSDGYDIDFQPETDPGTYEQSCNEQLTLNHHCWQNKLNSPVIYTDKKKICLQIIALLDMYYVYIYVYLH